MISCQGLVKMNEDMWFNLFGMVVTVAAAIFSLWQAKRAKEAAKEARSYIAEKMTSTEIASLQVYCAQAITAMKKYAPGSAVSRSAGANYGADADLVQEFLQYLKQDCRQHFGIKQPNEADNLCGRLENLLDHFIKEQPHVEIVPYGRMIYGELSQFASLIKTVQRKNLY